MTLAPGSRFGSYEVVALIGKGGMGEVYRARDVRLGRSVAVKILSAEFTSDPDRVQRFEREARVLAALNHPNIATIHGVEDVQGASALVMELVDGETLADRIARAPMPVASALAVARQLAHALDAAHEKGIVHRDLKPSNIKIASSGAVKVLDFGLAKEGRGVARSRGERDAGSSAAGATAVETINATVPGLLLGTAPYMSPEQVRGHDFDKRADIWAFGCVLFEMLTGTSPFGRSTVTDTIAAVLTYEPDWSLIATAPLPVQRAAMKCLEKDPQRRVRDLGDWDLVVSSDTTETSGAVAAHSFRRWLPWSVAAVAVAAAAVAVWFAATAAPRGIRPPLPVRFDVPPAVALSESGQFSVSPDGRHLVFAGTGDDRILRLWMKSLDAPEIRPLFGTEAEVVPVIPPMFWSPDSEFIAFYSDGKIKKVARSGGVPEVLCAVPGIAVGGTWNAQGDILVGNASGALMRCGADGDSPAVPVTRVEAPNIDHMMPSFLPDGRRFIYLIVAREKPSRSGIYLGNLDLAPDQQSRDRLLAAGYGAAYVPATGRSGYLLFVRDTELLAVPFDADRAAAVGEPRTVARPVGGFRDTAFFTASPATIVYRGATPDVQLTWVDRNARRVAVSEPGAYSRLALSPDGTKAVVVRVNRLNRADQDLWMVDLVRGQTTRFTSELVSESAPAWSANGTEVWYAVGTGEGDIYRKSANGDRPAELALRASSRPNINSATTSLALRPDGTLLFTASSGRAKDDLWLLPGGAASTPLSLLESDFDQNDGHISPDGRWIAYVSNESRSPEVFMRSLTIDRGKTGVGPGVLVSRGGGRAPRWRADSRELYYQTLDATIMAVPVVGKDVGTPIELARVLGALPDWGVSPDGQRFLVALPVQQTAVPPFTVLVNWQTSLGGTNP